MTDLATSVEAILDAMETALRSAAVTDGALDGIETVTRGSSARPMPKLPVIWLVPDQATFVQASYGTETWTLPVTLAALVKGQPVDAARLSQTFAAKARAIALAARPDPEDEIALTDITSQTWDPTAHSSESNRSLFWTEATVLVTFDCDS